MSLARSRISEAVIAQLVARRSHNPKVVSSILTHRTLLCIVAVDVRFNLSMHHITCQAYEIAERGFDPRTFGL